MTLIPLTILWEVLTGGLLFNMNVLDNLTHLVNGFGNGGFAGLIVLVIATWFFMPRK